MLSAQCRFVYVQKLVVCTVRYVMGDEGSNGRFGGSVAQWAKVPCHKSGKRFDSVGFFNLCEAVIFIHLFIFKMFLGFCSLI